MLTAYYRNEPLSGIGEWFQDLLPMEEATITWAFADVVPGQMVELKLSEPAEVYFDIRDALGQMVYDTEVQIIFASVTNFQIPKALGGLGPVYKASVMVVSRGGRSPSLTAALTPVPLSPVPEEENGPPLLTPKPLDINKYFLYGGIALVGILLLRRVL